MVRPGLGRARLGWLAIGLAHVLAGCCPPPEVGPPMRPPAPAAGFEVPQLVPSVELRLLRDERLASIAPLAPPPGAVAESTNASDSAPALEVGPAPSPDADTVADPSAEDDPSSDATPSSDADASAEDEVRQLIVPRRPRLATPEALLRAKIREAEPRRPRALYVSRLLVRTSGPLCGCDGSRKVRAEARRLVDAIVDRARASIQGCLADDLTRDPRVLIDAPALVVVAQAMRTGPLAYGFAPTMRLGPRGVEVQDLGWPSGDAIDEGLRTCLVRALESADVGPTSLPREHRVQVPLVAFSQQAWGFNLGGFHGALAFQAAALGWQHYERGEHEEALELFRDAHWAYHLGEYRYLEGLALEQLGRLDAAANAYAEYLAERPYAPEAPTLQGRIDRLRARARTR
jgi:hypothetical protein